MKSNVAYFQKLCKAFNIVCIQEHWLWEFQSQEISNLSSEKDFIIHCSDYLEPITGDRLPRGKGGVCILWPKEWSSKVKRLNDGNERVVAVEVTCNRQDKLCLINTYMPTNNSSVNSHLEYRECLDTIHNMLIKYRQSHKIILCGDFNGTLLGARLYNKHDQLLQEFVKEHCINFVNSKLETFFHHSGLGSSQIDYIMTTQKNLISMYYISDKEPENTSSHVKVSCRINISPPEAGKIYQNNSSKSLKKLQWAGIDRFSYEQTVQEELQRYENNGSVGSGLEGLVNSLHKATEAAVPHKMIRLKGPTWRASPTVKHLLSICKEKYKLWSDSDKSDEKLKKENVIAKRTLRKQLRKEKFEDRKNFYEDLMSNPTTEKFYQLIRRNRANGGKQTNSLVVNGEEVYSPDGQRNAFAKYYEELSVPQDHGYDSAFLELCNVRHELINKLYENNPEMLDPITSEEVTKAISQLNAKKSPDETGLTAEHLKYAGKAAANFISILFNQIMTEKKVPDMFKTGILTPVLKKAKDATCIDNYRGITVTPILGKLFEMILLPRLSKDFKQSSLQFGFTKGLSPIMSALIVSEARAEAKMDPTAPLFLMTLDSSKAFDVVSHTILLDKLYEAGIHPTLWSIVKDMYTGLTSKVKWIGELSDSFKIQQGVRQGAILSPFFYKTYLNPCLLELEENRLGLCIGTSYCGCPACADDVALLTRCENELQLMTNVIKRNCNQDRVSIHPTKSNVVLLKNYKSFTKKNFQLELNGNNLSLSESTTHLGLLRSEVNENVINIEDRLSLARRTLYSLISTGVHGSNGLNPRCSYKIYQCYVLPRLLFGLEALPLTKTQISILSKFHISNLRRFQTLPLRTATCAIYLLIGALPLEAELHKRHLSLLYNILTSNNKTISELTVRQIAVNLDNNQSYYSRVQDILNQYNLPNLHYLSENLTTKEQWKLQVKTAVNKYWTETLRKEAQEKSTLKYINIHSMKIGQTHPVWSSLESTVTDVRKGITKSRMLTGTYLLQSNRNKFNNSESAICKCCGIEIEDILHMLLECPALFYERKKYFEEIRALIVKCIGAEAWQSTFNTKDKLVSLILDCSSFVCLTGKRELTSIEKATTELCQRLHLARLHKLDQ